MVRTIDMQHMRYLNLFGKITKVNTRFCFNYNNAIMFGVPRRFVLKSIGQNAENLKKINHILGKRIKVVAIPNGVEDAKYFIKHIVSPVEFKDLEVKEHEIILTAGSQSKAALIGRNKRRLHEMQKIVHDFFGKDFRVV